jgi:hypothetical protein
MTAEHAAGPAVAAFGDLEQNVWGVAFGGTEPCLALAAVEAPEPAPLEAVTLSGLTGESWSITGAGRSLALAGASEAPVARTGSEPGGVELCRVTGDITADGVRCAALPDGRLDSLRLVAAWFPEDRSFALLSGRPAGVAGQDRDAIAVQVLGEPEGMTVFDPRLSTTYGSDGAPRRMGIELWIGETEDGDQYPRRVAGEVTGATAHDAGGGWRWHAYALRCHSRGADGAGVYVVIHPA